MLELITLRPRDEDNVEEKLAGGNFLKFAMCERGGFCRLIKISLIVVGWGDDCIKEGAFSVCLFGVLSTSVLVSGL